jgi:hypothetical protein
MTTLTFLVDTPRTAVEAIMAVEALARYNNRRFCIRSIQNTYQASDVIFEDGDYFYDTGEQE